MKSAFALLALTAAVGTSVFGALSAAPIPAPDVTVTPTATLMQSTSSTAALVGSALVGSAQVVTSPAAITSAQTDAPAAHIVLADNDSDEHWFKSRKKHHDDENDDEDDDDGGMGSKAMNPAPAGTAPPPANGLFNNATPPQVQAN
ncbi:hypothetical protein [uncultured Thioclava sp.]|uniref:hypothetical protein n=1 Tax=uncultured Thioclava sp. TaxID=473858 RepID=UPI0025ED5BC6|nr:hypothetical protein [uncultured Thioclava sp.]